MPGFIVPVRALPQAPVASAAPLPADAPLLVVADTHGEYEILVQLLRRQGVVDDALNWSFGSGHLVMLGDVFDRGPHQLEILWLIYKLEQEAAEAGGGVHLVLGNHEAMVLRGDLRYLHPRYPRVAAALGHASYDTLFGHDTLLGQWLRAKPAMLWLGDMLFLHGGVSPALVVTGLELEEINAIVRASLDIPVAAPEQLHATAQLVMGRLGPLWYRGYFPEHADFPTATLADIEAGLRRFGVERIFVGHTVVPEVSLLYGGRVVAVQVYPRREEVSGHVIMEAALRIDGVWYRARVNGARAPLFGE